MHRTVAWVWRKHPQIKAMMAMWSMLQTDGPGTPSRSLNSRFDGDSSYAIGEKASMGGVWADDDELRKIY